MRYTNSQRTQQKWRFASGVSVLYKPRLNCTSDVTPSSCIHVYRNCTVRLKSGAYILVTQYLYRRQNRLVIYRECIKLAMGRSLVQRSPTECLCHWAWSSAAMTLKWVGSRGQTKKERIKIAIFLASSGTSLKLKSFQPQ